MSARPAMDPNAVTVVLAPACGDRRNAARRLLSRVADELLGAPAAARIERDGLGRPYLTRADGAELQVSISHCDDVVAVALTRSGRVGVDVELLRTLPALRLAGRYFDRAEAQWLADRPAAGRTPDFLRLWTAKEALGKALGVGLRGGGLRRRVPPELLVDADELSPLPDGPDLSLALPPAPYGLVVAVAAQGSPAGLPLRLYGSGHAGCRPWPLAGGS
ncbi:4'-phosphopantetheinyl transferase family protein [Streptomyces sp. RKAG337]|uniref:4'-phosphopantetheinyl transferase family protein n=1 Tax=Streptomyces sp. RKAG337 TaxID=2893404 RepID=UPI002033AD5A|nr:4'-phosphopantetheinyl transferase superfamily protein [Streptomyces sp. RKAG337]MCM2429994.1 4'-phosphopantetheinyl transferase superfamily protein [Streptomyces sp. RKAG337]